MGLLFTMMLLCGVGQEGPAMAGTRNRKERRAG